MTLILEDILKFAVGYISSMRRISSVCDHFSDCRSLERRYGFVGMDPNERNPSELPPPPREPEAPVKPRDYTMGMLCHLLALTALLGVPFGNVLGPLVIWLIKKEEDPFVDACGKESLNFQITAMIATLALVLLAGCAMILSVIPIAGFFSLLLLPLIGVSALALFIGVTVFTIIAAIRSSEGQMYRYPYTIRLIR